MRIVSLAFLLWTAPAMSALAESAPSPAEAGVRLEKPVGDNKQYSQGSGVFLGHGLVLTALHVVEVNKASKSVTVLVDGRRTDGTVVWDGKHENLDLALVKIDPSALSAKRRAQPEVTVCSGNPGPSQPVTVAAMGIVTPTTTISTAITSDGKSEGWTNLLSTGFHHGNSGGGVFSAAQGCLWGIVTFEMGGNVRGQAIDITAFAPSSDIAVFLKDYYSRR